MHYQWIITGVAFFTMLVSAGTRSSFGAFLTPMQADFGTGRAPLALAVSIGSLVGAFCQPLVGKLADSFGARRVLAGGVVVTGLGLLGVSFAQDLIVIYAIFGLILAVGFSASGVIPNSAMVTRWFTKSRALALSIASAGFSTGQVVMLPVAAHLIERGGWRFAYASLSAVFFVVVLPVVLILGRDHPGDISAPGEIQSTTAGVPGDFTPLRKAMKTATFWKLLATFGVCGFTGGLAYTHLIPFALDGGMSATSAASLLAVAGTIGVGFSIVVSTLSDRVGRKNPLSGLYFMKGFSLLLLAVVGGVAAIPFVSLTLGMSKGTGALTSAMTGDYYGRLSVGVIYGMVFFGHEIMSAAGSYLGGLAFDVMGTYGPIFLVGAAVGLLGSFTAFSIKEQRVQPSTPVGAASV